MIRKITNRIKVLALLIATLFISNSCSDLLNNPLKDKETGEDITLLLLDLKVFDTQLAVSLKDSKSGDVISDDKMQIFFTGKDADKIVDGNGKKDTIFNVPNGFLEVNLDPSIIPSEDNPVEFQVVAISGSNLWVGFPKEVSITENGIYDIEIEMDELIGGEEFGGDEFEFLNFEQVELKSSTLGPLAATNPPFNLSLSCPNGVVKVTYDPVRVEGGNEIYYMVYPSAWYMNKKVTFNVSNYTGGKTYTDYGMVGWYWINNNCRHLGNSDGTFQKMYDLNDTRNFNFYAIAKRPAQRCKSGVRISIENTEKLKGSAQFNYVIKFSDGSSKKGIVTASFRNSNNYISSLTISPIYYPFGDQKATIELSSTGTYDIENKSISLTEVCGSKPVFKVKPKSGLRPYKVTTSISCEASPAGAAPTMRGTISGPGLTGPTPFLFEQGIANLNLLPNEDYKVSGTYNGTSASFSLTTKTDAASINKIIDEAKTEYPEFKSISLSVTSTDINIGLVYNEASCPF